LAECPLDLNRIEMRFAELKTASTPPNLPEQAIDDALELLSDLSECASYCAIGSARD
jgi:hypothetical protein